MSRFPVLSPERNKLATLTGPGTPCGKLMRHYWQPAALIEELDGTRCVKPVRLLGEQLGMRTVFHSPENSSGSSGK